MGQSDFFEDGCTQFAHPFEKVLSKEGALWGKRSRRFLMERAYLKIAAICKFRAWWLFDWLLLCVCADGSGQNDLSCRWRLAL